jgi:hypothetical protein
MSKERFDAYLWDRSGEPDEQLRTLEMLLERYRYDGIGPATAGDPNAEANEEEAPAEEKFRGRPEVPVQKPGRLWA